MAQIFLLSSGSLYPILYHLPSMVPFQNHLNSVCFKIHLSLISVITSLVFIFLCKCPCYSRSVKINSIEITLCSSHSTPWNQEILSPLPSKYSCASSLLPSRGRHKFSPETWSLLWLLLFALATLLTMFSGMVPKHMFFHTCCLTCSASINSYYSLLR